MSAPTRAPHVAERTPHEVYAGECASARDHLRQGRAGQAAEAARRALAALPRGLDGQRLLGLALLELGEARAAAHAFSAALAADPLDVVALVGTAESQELLEGAGGAEAAWQRAWEVEPSTETGGEARPPGIARRLQTSRRAAGALDVRDGPPPLTRAALARVHLRGRLFEHAAIEARAVLARDPDRMDVRLTLAEAYWRAGEGELAAAVAAEIKERQPDCVVANLLVAAQWIAEGRDIGELLSRVHAVDPTGSIAQALFDDREAPAIFGIGDLSDRPVPPPAETPTSELAETRPLDVMARAEAVPASDEAEPNAEPAADVGPTVAESVPALEREPESEPVAAVASVPAELVAAPDEAPQPLPIPEPEPEVDTPAAEPVSPPAPHDDRAAGNEAMAAGRYLDAVRAYGAWLRALRAAGPRTL